MIFGLDLSYNKIMSSHPSSPDTSRDNKVVAIRNSDRVSFLRCRRKWHFQSGIRQNLEPVGMSAVSPLWFGTGFHFAMEDFHGYKRYPTAFAAFEAYVGAFRRTELPDDIDDLVPLARGMITHYVDEWLPRRRQFKTVWIDGVPQVEVEFKVRIPGSGAYYTGTFDRVVEDMYGRWWVLDYKTAKKFDTMQYELNPQVSAYAWAATELYKEDFEGVVLQQHLKDVPDEPRVLNNGSISKDMRQNTTYKRYVRALRDRYDGKVPAEYIDVVNSLARRESPEGDKFVLRTMIRRNDHQRLVEAAILRAQSQDMLSPDTALYPNPTRDCSWDCPFREVCIAMNDGSDWSYMLGIGFVSRAEEDNSWRKRIKYPEPRVISNLPE